MATTSFEILLLIIHLLSCDMIFLMYALTWSSDVTLEVLVQLNKRWTSGLTQHVEAIFLYTTSSKPFVITTSACTLTL